MRACVVLLLALAIAGCKGTTSANKGEPNDGKQAEGKELPLPETLPAPASLEDTRKAYSRGVAYLVTHQNSNGTWGSIDSSRPYQIYLGTLSSLRAFQDATASLCVMALVEASRRDPSAMPVLEKGLAHLLSSEPVARAQGDTLYDNWTHIFMLHAMAVVARDPRFASKRAEVEKIALREIGILEVQESTDGGWGYYDFGWTLEHPAGDETTSFMTAAALVAFDEAKKSNIAVSDRLVRDALRSLERLRQGNGSYIYGNYAKMWPVVGFNEVKGSLGRSQSGNLALWRNGRVVTKEDLRKGIENLMRHHHFIEMGRGRPIPHESWYYTAGYYYLFGHFYASKVLAELDSDDRAKWCPILSAILIRGQDPEGSWFDYPLYGYYRAYGTALGLLALEGCLPR